MDFFDAVNDLVARYGVPEHEARIAMDDEADNIRSDSRAKGRRATSYQAAIVEAHERIGRWIEEGAGAAPALDWSALATYVSGHRRAAIWATFIGLARKAKEAAP